MKPALWKWVRVLVAVVLALRATTQCDLAWQPSIGGANHYVNAVAGLRDGSLVVGGSFSSIGPLANTYIAVFRDGAWTHLGSGVQGGGLIGGVNSILLHPNGDIVVGGIFQVAGGVAVNHIARWDGSTWHALGGGVTGGYGYTWIDEMVAMPNGDIVIAGRFYGPVPWLARWNGSAWSDIGNGGWEGTEGLAVAQDGTLFVAYNTGAGAVVMRWDGAVWTQLGTGTSSWRVLELEITADGELLAGGYNPALRRWTGSQWLPVGSGPAVAQIRGMQSLPGGDLIAVGSFSPPLAGAARWDGVAWLPIAGGLSSLGVNAVVGFDVTKLRDGGIAVGGWFDFAGGIPAQKLAIAASTCPAGAVSYGGNCSGSAGPVLLAATQWAMLGGVMRSRATGLTPNALAVSVYGFSQINVPLSSGHPLGLPGCNVRVADEILLDFLPGNGAVESSIQVPLQPLLIGAQFHHQVVSVELDSLSGIQALASSNGLTLTIGAY